MLKVGSTEIHTLTDAAGPFPRKLDEVFPEVRREQWLPYRRRYPQVFVDSNTWHCHFGCFLLRMGGRNILVDTGVGRNNAQWNVAEGELVGRLAEIGLSPNDIATVFFTHMHGDHVSGALGTDGEPAFPNATYMLHQADWELLRATASQGRFADSRQIFAKLDASDRLTLMKGGESLTPEVTTTLTPGHTPGSTSLVVSAEGEGAIILGDVLHHPALITEPHWTVSFDADKQQAADTRARVVDQAEKDRLTLVPGHFPAPCFGRVVRSRGKRIWKALE